MEEFSENYCGAMIYYLANKEKFEKKNININYEINYDATESDGWGPNGPVQEYVTGINDLRIQYEGSNLESGDEVFLIIEKILKDNGINIDYNDINNIEFPLLVTYENNDDEVDYKIEEVGPKWGSFNVGNDKIEISFNENNDILIDINNKDIIHIKYSELKRLLEKVKDKLEDIESEADFN